MRAKLYFGALVALAMVASTASLAATPAASGGIIVVPAGHLSKTPPKVYSGSRVLTGLGGGSFATKYKKVYALFKNDPRLVAKIKKAAAAYGIDPIHIIGAIVGEHTFNIDTYDTLQTYYVKALQYVDNTSLTFSFHGQTRAAALRHAAIRQVRDDRRRLRAMGLPADGLERLVLGQDGQRQALPAGPAAPRLLPADV